MVTRKKTATKKSATKVVKKVTHKAPAKKTVKDFVGKVVEKVKEVVAPPPVVEPVPAPAPEPSPAIDITAITSAAWDAVRGDDAVFADCVPDFKATLIAHAEAVNATYQVMDGDTNLARFEREVYRRLTNGTT